MTLARFKQTRAARLQPHLAYRPDIDGLRAVAVLAVVGYHASAGVVPGGFAGVDVFFVISGFLISSIVFEALSRGQFNLADFYTRRIRRLMPSLVIVLGAAWAIGWVSLLDDEFAQLGTHIASSAMCITNVVLWGETGYFDAAAGQKPLLHLWSLGVEEQFYLVWPVLLLLCWRRVSVIYPVLGVAVVSFVLNVGTVGRYPSAAFYWPTSRLWELAIGSALAYASLADGSRVGLTLPGHLRWLSPPTRPRAQHACAGIGLLLLGAGFVVLRGQFAFPGWWALFPTTGSFLLIAAGPRAWVNRVVLSHPVLVFVGLISYPLYLWHWPLLTFLRVWTGGEPRTLVLFATVALSFTLAWLSFWFIERPLRRAGPGGVLVPAALLASGAFVGSLGLYVRVKGAELPDRFPAAVQSVVNFRYEYSGEYRERTCYLMPDQPPGALAPGCLEAAPAGRPMLVLWGDSHAAHLYPGLRRLQATMLFRLAQITGSRCPPLLDVDTPMQPFCQDVNRFALEQIRVLKPESVLLAARWRLYNLSSLDRTIAALRSVFSGRILLLGPVPHWDTRLPRVLFNYFRQHPWQPLPRRLSFGLADYVWDFEREVRDRAVRSTAEYVSAVDVLCNQGGCVTSVGTGSDALTAWDESHLTTAGSEYLISQIADRLFADTAGADARR